ncbi:DUF1636 domain-containing protein [Sphingomonas sp. MMSM20]|uniref:DUF1636 domain-containing protein n=1 Tax=Sphingomonas lycopersici TaxID=2951807 RepID=UPI002237F6A0|nr:DUF1636 domain-containing protein [Sphingomonas lycopersici]MCW6529140.1 DUF1636 domain-containing protein [Sphingomonas lycopersici]
MLKPVPGGAAVVACNTCRNVAGAALVAALRRVQGGDAAYAEVAVQEMPCLFACRESCTVHLRAPGKIGYVLGRFDPTDEAARAILDYARAYAASEWGQVPYRDWPEGVKGHFITRTPPEGYVVA